MLWTCCEIVVRDFSGDFSICTARSQQVQDCYSIVMDLLYSFFVEWFASEGKVKLQQGHNLHNTFTTSSLVSLWLSPNKDTAFTTSSQHVHSTFKTIGKPSLKLSHNKDTTFKKFCRTEMAKKHRWVCRGILPLHEIFDKRKAVITPCFR